MWRLQTINLTLQSFAFSSISGIVPYSDRHRGALLGTR